MYLLSILLILCTNCVGTNMSGKNKGKIYLSVAAKKEFEDNKELFSQQIQELQKSGVTNSSKKMKANLRQSQLREGDDRLSYDFIELNDKEEGAEGANNKVLLILGVNRKKQDKTKKVTVMNDRLKKITDANKEVKTQKAKKEENNKQSIERYERYEYAKKALDDLIIDITDELALDQGNKDLEYQFFATNADVDRELCNFLSTAQVDGNMIRNQMKGAGDGEGVLIEVYDNAENFSGTILIDKNTIEDKSNIIVNEVMVYNSADEADADNIIIDYPEPCSKNSNKSPIPIDERIFEED